MTTKTPDDVEVTGNCYDDAVNEQLKRKPDWLLVHGRPRLRRDPFCEYGHAWLEKDEEVFCPSTGFQGPRWLYYSFGKINYKDNLVYTVGEAQRFLVVTEHYGPWEGVDGTPPTEEQLEHWRGRLPERSQGASKPVPPLTPARVAHLLGNLSGGGRGHPEDDPE